MAFVGCVSDILFAVLLLLWRWFRVLWVCRVSALSAIGGGLFVIFTPQALDLFADTGLGVRRWIVFFVLLFGWAWVVHAMARRALQYDDWICEGRQQSGFDANRRADLSYQFYWPAVVIPRALGFVVFVCVGFALYNARHNLQNALEISEAAVAFKLILKLLVVTVLLAAFYLLAVWYRRDVRKRMLGQARPEPPLLAGKIPLLALLLHPRKHQTRKLLVKAPTVDKWLLVAWLVVGTVFGFALINPAFVADWFPRALFLPVLLGGGVLLIGEIAALSHRWETPLLLVLVGLGGIFSYLSSHYDDVRWTTPPEQSKVVGKDLEISFEEAVARWKAVNGCDHGQTCPSPIVIAGAGGASRAAFQTATVVGALIDLGLQDPSYGNLRNRIFALSTVSGSSVGAVVIRAALTDAAEDGTPDVPPCRNHDSGAWYGTSTDRQKDPTYDAGKYWRNCFQRLLAGDFLSAVMVGLAYRDNGPLGNPFTGRAFWSDRGVLLEQAFERRYYDVTGKGASACTDAVANGLCRRFGHHPDPKTAGAWLPLLFINGTSVSTGRRIVTSDVGAGSPANTVPLIQLAYDIGELRGFAQKDQKEDQSDLANEMFLSSAATTSCRFPVISPDGIIRDRNDNIIDRIVDGGYFENDGVATAADVVQALEGQGLHPIVLRIRNEPVEALASDRKLNRKGPDLPNSSERALFDVYVSIAEGLLATRSGHEDEETQNIQSMLDDKGVLLRIDVYPLRETASPVCRSASAAASTMKTVSMSWWLSQPVQAYLDGQLCVRENWTKLDCVLKAKDFGAAQACIRD